MAPTVAVFVLFLIGRRDPRWPFTVLRGERCLLKE
jgi:hypothetical protein